MARVFLRLPPQLLESARAMQLANRQKLLARESRNRLQAETATAAAKARSAAGLPAWPGAVPDPPSKPRSKLWSRNQVLTRGIVRYGVFGERFANPTSYTYQRTLRIYSLDGSTYVENSQNGMMLGQTLLDLRYPLTMYQLEVAGGSYVQVYPCTETSYLIVQGITKTVTTIEDPGVSTVVGGFGQAYNNVVAANPYRTFDLFEKRVQGWPIRWIYILGQDTFTVDFKAWLVHESGVKQVAVPQTFVQQAVSIQRSSNNLIATVGPAWNIENGVPTATTHELKIYGETINYTIIPGAFTVVGDSYLSVSVLPLVNTAAGGNALVYTYPSQARFLDDYEEPLISSGLAAITENPAAAVPGFSIARYPFTVTPPNQQTLPMAPISYLQGLGFSSSDLTP